MDLCSSEAIRSESEAHYCGRLGQGVISTFCSLLAISHNLLQQVREDTICQKARPGTGALPSEAAMPLQASGLWLTLSSTNWAEISLERLESDQVRSTEY